MGKGASYCHTIQDTPGQSIFCRNIIFNIAFITAGKQQQVEIENVQENYRQSTREYTIGNLLYVEITGLYRELDYKKQGPYIITEVF